MDARGGTEAIDLLIGRWEGTGRGEFPTLKLFEYREVFEVRATATASLLHYQQRTWRVDGTAEQASHLETGFISTRDDGTVEFLNVQGSDRIEVIRGLPLESEGTVTLELTSVVLAHDERMISSWRTLRFDQNTLRYSMGMKTTAVPAGALHLTGTLARIPHARRGQLDGAV